MYVIKWMDSQSESTSTIIYRLCLSGWRVILQKRHYMGLVTSQLHHPDFFVRIPQNCWCLVFYIYGLLFHYCYDFASILIVLGMWYVAVYKLLVDCCQKQRWHFLLIFNEYRLSHNILTPFPTKAQQQLQCNTYVCVIYICTYVYKVLSTY